jgi:hypothetical protein
MTEYVKAKRPIQKARGRWEEILKYGLKEMECTFVNQNTVQCSGSYENSNEPSVVGW